MIIQPIPAELSVFLMSAAVLMMVSAGIPASAAGAEDNRLIAIDILLQPDRTMIREARAVNARLRGDFPAGYELDATHAPHVTLLQRFVRVKDFDAVTAALNKALAEERPTELPLKATGYDYGLWSGRAVTAIFLERSPGLMRLQQKVADTIAPFAVTDGTAEAFVGPRINPETIAWVKDFVPSSSGAKYAPHVTAGVAGEPFVKQLKAESFTEFTFRAQGVAIYQLGNFGTAAAKLWQDRPEDPLPSWNDSAARTNILAFVDRVTRSDSPDFILPAERIAVFDNDGTLWAEQPLYFQFAFAIDRVKALAPQHPEWKEKEPFASLLRGDLKGLFTGGEHALVELVMASHTGMTTGEFERIVTDWVATAKHPTSGRPFTDMVYQPMLELLDYLRANGFKPFIVSGGGIEFMRAWAEGVYGIPPEQVVGSSGKTKFETVDGKPVLMRLPEVSFVDDKEGKPVGIQQHIGRRPIAAFGNSDGDLQMLQWTMAGHGARFALLVHHTDGEREWAYDRGSPIGGLDKALDEALAKGWTVVDMKADWKVVYPFQEQ